MWIRGGTRSLFECRSNEKGEDQKEKTNISTNSGCRLKILAIFYEFLSEDQKQDFRPKSFMKSGVSRQKLRKNSSCSRISLAVNTNLGDLGLDLHSSSP